MEQSGCDIEVGYHSAGKRRGLKFADEKQKFCMYLCIRSKLN
jgi:hypothetical protein